MPSFIDVFRDERSQWDFDGNRMQGRAIDYYYSYPGFFTPYRSTGDFFSTLASPITEPLTFGLLATLSIGISAATAVSAAASLVFAGGAALFWQQDAASVGLTVAISSAIISLVTGLAGLCLALLTVISIPVDLLFLTTRTAASVISPVVDCLQLTSVEPQLETPNL